MHCFETHAHRVYLIGYTKSISTVPKTVLHHCEQLQLQPFLVSGGKSQIHDYVRQHLQHSDKIEVLLVCDLNTDLPVLSAPMLLQQYQRQNRHVVTNQTGSALICTRSYLKEALVAVSQQDVDDSRLLFVGAGEGLCLTVHPNPNRMICVYDTLHHEWPAVVSCSFGLQPAYLASAIQGCTREQKLRKLLPISLHTLTEFQQQTSSTKRSKTINHVKRWIFCSLMVASGIALTSSGRWLYRCPLV